jgi:hypothetical protein
MQQICAKKVHWRCNESVCESLLFSLGICWTRCSPNKNKYHSRADTCDCSPQYMCVYMYFNDPCILS